MPLSPIIFLERAALVYSDKPSLVYGDLRFTKLASSLDYLGISYGDVVSTLINPSYINLK